MITVILINHHAACVARTVTKLVRGSSLCPLSRLFGSLWGILTAREYSTHSCNVGANSDHASSSSRSERPGSAEIKVSSIISPMLRAIENMGGVQKMRLRGAGCGSRTTRVETVFGCDRGPRRSSHKTFIFQSHRCLCLILGSRASIATKKGEIVGLTSHFRLLRQSRPLFSEMEGEICDFSTREGRMPRLPTRLFHRESDFLRTQMF